MSVSNAQSEGITMSGGGLYSLATTGAKHVQAVARKVPNYRLFATRPTETDARY